MLFLWSLVLVPSLVMIIISHEMTSVSIDFLSITCRVLHSFKLDRPYQTIPLNNSLHTVSENLEYHTYNHLCVCFFVPPTCDQKKYSLHFYSSGDKVQPLKEWICSH
jgi:hypothetical protein